MDSFELELKQSFIDEASQLLAEIEQCFLSLENGSDSSEVFNKIFRLAHNIKGSARAVGFESVGHFAHEFETFLLKIKEGKIKASKSTIDLMLACNDRLVEMIDELKSNMEATFDSSELIAKIQSHTGDEDQEETISPEEIQPLLSTPALGPESSAPQVNSSSLDSQPPKSLEPSTPPAATAKINSQSPTNPQPSSPSGTSSGAPSNASANPKGPPPKDESIRVSLGRVEKLVNYVGELVILQTVLSEQTLNPNPLSLRRTANQMGKVVKEIQDISMSLRMIPIKQTFQKMQRIVRDTSSMLGKEIHLHLQGEETEIDKTILEQINDPLVHLVRNACDHGIESPTERVAQGKSPQGSLLLSAYHQADRLVIEVRDDGGGIDPEKLRQKAYEKGILKPNQKITDSEAIHLIFHSGFSTKAQASEVSGRGVGMDVVKTNIEALQGEIRVETAIHKGTTFKLILPLTLAIIDSMIVKLGDERYVIPLSHVHESVQLKDKDLKFTMGIGEVLMLRGENLPVFRLSLLLGKKASKSEVIALIIRNTSTPFALLVDDIIGQHQVVIKKLGAEVGRIRGFSGSAILGDGRPALILEVNDLVTHNRNFISQNHLRRATA